MSTHNVCFGLKIRKLGIPLQTPVFLYKSGVCGVYISRTDFPNVIAAHPRKISYSTNDLAYLPP